MIDVQHANMNFIALIIILCVSIACGDLYHSLEELEFKNSGTITSKDIFQWQTQCSFYVESQNVSTVGLVWANNGAYSYLYQKNTSAVDVCTPSSVEKGTDRPGGDYMAYTIDTEDPMVCQAACCNDSVCHAWVYAVAPVAFMNCTQGKPCCYLKGYIPTTNSNPICTSGTVSQSNTGIVPPSGMRSAVPIGGIGTGSFELRVDGTFHEWTIINSGPAGGAKMQILDEAVLGLSVQQGISKVTKLLRTSPPNGLEGVAQLSYSGAYPVSKLKVTDPDIAVEATVYAFSQYEVGDQEASTTPAAAFVLNVHNPLQESVEVSFFLNLPFGYEPDQDRPGTASYKHIADQSPEQCHSACQADQTCQSWTVASNQTCLLRSSVNLNIYSFGTTSGIKGSWRASNDSLTFSRIPSYPASGDITLTTIESESITPSYGTALNFASLWADFSSKGLNKSINANGIHGAYSVTAMIGAGENVSLPIVFGWYFPNRDWVGEIYGNFYANIFENSVEVAEQVATNLENIVSSLTALHQTFFDNSLPEFLQDSLVNSLSHVRAGVFLKDGRWRQYEAFDCQDVDSVHNDFQRQLPYILFFPDLLKTQIEAWAKLQQSDGMIQEALAGWGANGATLPLDTGGGRVMADVTSVFIIEALQVYTWTGDEAFIESIWPAVQMAIKWQIAMAAQHGLPSYITCTYDILNLQVYELASFNGAMHLTSMLACMKLGSLMNAPDMIAACNASFLTGQRTFLSTLWNGEYLTAFNGGSAVMADTLYGQVWAYTLGLGNVLPENYLRSHIAAELSHNDSPYGLLVMTGRASDDAGKIKQENYGDCNLFGPGQDNSIWMGGSPDWAVLEININSNVSGAMWQAQKALDQWRVVLNDQWNTHGLLGGVGYGVDGQPLCTSHYGFHMVEWHIPFAVSGQQYSALTQTLQFSPKLDGEFKLPFFIPKTTGYLSYDDGDYTVGVTIGILEVEHVIIDGVDYGGVNLVAGESTSWTARQLHQ